MTVSCFGQSSLVPLTSCRASFLPGGNPLRGSYQRGLLLLNFFCHKEAAFRFSLQQREPSLRSQLSRLETDSYRLAVRNTRWTTQGSATALLFDKTSLHPPTHPLPLLPSWTTPHISPCSRLHPLLPLSVRGQQSLDSLQERGDGVLACR